jgi:hypothetical protein
MGDSNWMKIPGQDRGWNNPALHDVDGTMAALASTSPVSQSKVAEYLLTLGRAGGRAGRERNATGPLLRELRAHIQACYNEIS